jgi:hypothetical protein
MKKNVFIVIVVSLVAFCFIGCATQSNNTAIEVWRDVESGNDVVGKWEGSIIIDIPQNDEVFMPETSVEVTIFMEYIRDADIVNSYMKMDFARLLTDWSNMQTVKLAGLTKEDLWEAMVEGLESEGVNIGGEYFVKQDLSDNVDTFFSDEAGKLQINTSGNKLKLVFYEAVTMGLGDSGFTEITM